jgi:hypothetical protein
MNSISPDTRRTRRSYHPFTETAGVRDWTREVVCAWMGRRFGTERGEEAPSATRILTDLVDLVGIEPTTSPASRGARASLPRIDQHLDRAMRFPALQLPFATARFRNCVELFPID